VGTCGRVVSMLNTVGQFANEDVIKKYIQNQGKEVKYTKLHEAQLNLEL